MLIFAQKAVILISSDRPERINIRDLLLGCDVTQSTLIHVSGVVVYARIRSDQGLQVVTINRCALKDYSNSNEMMPCFSGPISITNSLLTATVPILHGYHTFGVESRRVLATGMYRILIGNRASEALTL